MCTTGALHLGADHYVLFKNKDFGRAHFDDRLVCSADVFGVEGVSTWAGTDPMQDEFSGFSLGANRHGLLVGDANVRTVAGADNYDKLVEIALREGVDVDTGVAAIEAAVAHHEYYWANVILVDRSGCAAVEVRGTSTHVERAPERIVRTNHHVVLGATADDDDTTTTADRYRWANTRLADADGLDDIFALQRSHDAGHTGLCNHLGYDTVYSYAFEHRAGMVRLHVLQGRPCEVPERAVFELPLGAAWSPQAAEALSRAYPSAHERVPL